MCKQVYLLIVVLPYAVAAAPQDIRFSQSAENVDAYDFVEVTADVSKPEVANPFTEATLRGSFSKRGETAKLNVDGFCDSSDGTVFRIRLTPPAPGDYSYSLEYRQGNFTKTHAGMFHATDGHRRGPIRVDAKYPWHFIWEGTGEHYFFNGTTAFWLPGWRDDRVIDYSIERLHRMKINRIRVLLAGRRITIGGNRFLTETTFP